MKGNCFTTIPSEEIHITEKQKLPFFLNTARILILGSLLLLSLLLVYPRASDGFLLIFGSQLKYSFSNKPSLVASIKAVLGLPWWHSGWESACQCRGHGFEPWSGKILHATEQLGPWATTTEPARLEPVLRNKRDHDSERPAYRDEE